MTIEAMNQLGATSQMAGLDETVRRMQREILHDVVAGIVPRTARSFAELGSSRDLSIYGGFSEMGSQGQLSEALTVHMQKAQDHVDVWLFYGGLEKEGLPPGWKPATDETKHQFDPWGYKSQDPVYELAVRSDGVPTLDLMVLQDGEKFIGVHGTVKMDAFDSPNDAAEQASKWGVENGWGEEIMRQALWPEAKKSLKGNQLLFTVGTGNGWNCHASDGLGIRLDPVGAGAAWDWCSNRAWMASCGTGQAATREEAIDAALGALLDAGISVDALPSEVSGKLEPGPLPVMQWVGIEQGLPPEHKSIVVMLDSGIPLLGRNIFGRFSQYDVINDRFVEWMEDAESGFHGITCWSEIVDVSPRVSNKLVSPTTTAELTNDDRQQKQVQSVASSQEEIFLHHEIYIEPSKDSHRDGFEWSVCRNGVELDTGQEFSVDAALTRAKGVVTAKFDELTATAAKQVGAAYTFCQVASEMLAAAHGDVSTVDWDAFNNEVIQRSIVQNKQPPASVETVLLDFSPGAITNEQQRAVLMAVRKADQQLDSGTNPPDVHGLVR